MKRDCVEHLGENLYSKKNNNNNVAYSKCLMVEGKHFDSECEKLQPTDTILNVCENVQNSSFATAEEIEIFRKKRCDDRYESSDSGVGTLRCNCSESSSHSGTSDITDPGSPYSITSIHSGEESSHPSPAESIAPPQNIVPEINLKMLPDSLSREDNEVPCWTYPFDKAIEWNERFELTPDDIDAEVKASHMYDGMVVCDEEKPETIPITPLCAGAGAGAGAGNSHTNDNSFNFSLNVKILGNKSAADVDENYDFDETDIQRCPVNDRVDCSAIGDKEESSSLSESKQSSVATNNNKLVLHDVFFNNTPEKETPKAKQEMCSENCVPMCTENSNVDYSEIALSEANELDDENDISAFDSNESLATASRGNKTLVNNDYPIDLFNILPSVFKYSTSSNKPFMNGLSHNSDHLDSSSDSSDSSVIKLSSIFKNQRKVSRDNSSSAILSNCIEEHNASNELSISTSADQPNSESTVIRFPSCKKPSLKSHCLCHWTDCTEQISSSSKLIEHLQTKHVNPQTFGETFVCLWTGCKVYSRPSCSRLWLERHVLSHGGNRPFRCIIDGCGGQRFSSQLMLERHINRHFKKSNGTSNVDTAQKLIRRNGQKLRYRRQPFSARGKTDIFDAGIMSQLQYTLVEMTKNCKEVSLDVMNSETYLHITFQPKVIGSRVDLNGEKMYLVRWYPYNALDDEWLPPSEAEQTKSIPLWKLPTKVQEPFWDIMFPNRRGKPAHQPRKYKP